MWHAPCDMRGMIELKNVERVYPLKGGPFYALRAISLSIEEGDFVSVMGPSGSGKSTLLNILGLHDSQWTGEYHFAGAKVHVQLTGIVSKSLDLTLPDIHLTDLGTGTDGITAAELTQDVLKEVISSTIKSVGEAAASITNVTGKTLNGTVNKIKSGLGGIFGK